jgi:hypothetical protein
MEADDLVAKCNYICRNEETDFFYNPVHTPKIPSTSGRHRPAYSQHGIPWNYRNVPDLRKKFSAVFTLRPDQCQNERALPKLSFPGTTPFNLAVFTGAIGLFQT